MKLKLCLIISLSLLTVGTVFGQEANYWPGHQTLMMDNPGITGCGVEGVMRISYLNFFPGKGYNFHSGFISYDSYFPAIHGGAGIYISDDYAGGIMNETRGGISYAYYLQAGREL
ncbi:MAG: hypothetical protein Q8868_03035, partial [Bacteroidota bacterium]|nr:hypothetical protein [Bacteroidota bacterium]